MYYNETEARKLVVEAGRKLLENKLAARTWGNISARTGEDSFVITPSGKAYEGLKESDLVTVRISDCSYQGDVKPSSEKGVHADAYAIRDDISFVIHTHQRYASAVAAECSDISFAPCAEYGLPGTEKLRKNVKACLEENPGRNAILMARHGTLLLGKDPDEAFGLAADLEEKCRALVETRVPDHDKVRAEAFDTEKIKIRALPYVVVADDPYIMECCKAGTKVGSYVDDFAQIVGPDMSVVRNDPWVVERALLGYSTDPVTKGIIGRMPLTGVLPRMGDQQPALNSIIGRNAVLVKGVGAVCAGKTKSDAEAIAMIVAKNCTAASYVRHEKPLGTVDARLQRFIYLTSYSKLTGDNNTAFSE